MQRERIGQLIIHAFSGIRLVEGPGKTMNTSIDWTAPAAYLRGLIPIPRWRLAAAWLIDALDRSRLAVRTWRTARKLRRFQSCAEHLPNYLREDIGLPPIKADRYFDLSNYR